jgi:protoheme IX farnesyltransferase
VLGGVVVANDLSPWLVVVHLGLAMMILGFLVAATVMAAPSSLGVPDHGFRRLMAAVTGLTYLLLLTGSTVVASSADRGCQTWPLCGGGFALDFGGANAYTMLHRGAVLVIGIVIVYALVSAIRRSGRQSGIGRSAAATLLAFAAQIAVGAGAALTDGAFFNGLHVALATLVWSGVLTTAVLTLPRADSGAELSRLAVGKSSA